MKHCRDCGSIMSETEKFCTHCGARDEFVGSFINERSNKYDDDYSGLNYEKDNEGCFLSIKKFFGIASIVICFVVGIALNSGWLDSPLMNFLGGNEYIEMVQMLRPFNGGRTYYSAFESAFDKSEWEYFESNGKKFVQVTSTFDDLDDRMITQFSLTPTGERGEYWIEPYAIRVSGRDLTGYEMDLVLAALFEGELMGLLLGL